MSSDDFEADISFAKRKKELQSLYKEFQSALIQMKSIPEFTADDTVLSSKSSILQAQNQKKSSQIQMNYEIHSLIREIQSLKNETIEIKDSLQRAAKGRQYARIVQIIEKVDCLIKVLSSHMLRAQSILNSIERV